ncbi:hypothetical protein GCM10010336_07030 [Streptomyces goshikiensis]|nr:hypothetical protein GCM10010336_07030 [Streptomyces goshikiensis]
MNARESELVQRERSKIAKFPHPNRSCAAPAPNPAPAPPPPLTRCDRNPPARDCAAPSEEPPPQRGLQRLPPVPTHLLNSQVPLPGATPWSGGISASSYDLGVKINARI